MTDSSRQLPRWLKLLAGVLFILVGVLGIVLPILQGFLFLAAGLLLLSEVFPSLRKFVHKFEARHPSMKKVIRPFRARDGGLRMGKLLLIVLGITAVASVVTYFVVQLWS